MEDRVLDRIADMRRERWLEIISEASRHIPESWRGEYPRVPCRRVRDLGNVIRHAYDGVDFGTLWTIYEIHLDPLDAALEDMAATRRKSLS